MDLHAFLDRERLLWHRHFVPSLLAGLVVALISFLYEATISNVVLYASVGASAIILTHSRSHHLTRLHTTISAYVIMIVVSSLIHYANTLFVLHMSVNIFLVVFVVGMGLFLADAFHPPAVTASITFILLDRPLTDLLYLFSIVILLLIIVRFITYVLSQHLSVENFIHEFRRADTGIRK